MSSVNIRGVVAVIAAMAALVVSCRAQTSATDIEDLRPADLEKELSSALGSLDQGLAGETIDPATGSISFQTVDVELPGNSGLPVRFGRFYSDEGVDYFDNALGGWNFDIPFITARVYLAPETFFLNLPQENRDFATLGWLNDECWSFFAESVPDPKHRNRVSQGTRLFLGGGGGELVGAAYSEGFFGSNGPQKTTRSFVRLDCVPYTGTGSGSHAIRAVDTDGVTYYFNRVSLQYGGVVGIEPDGDGSDLDPPCNSDGAPGPGCPYQSPDPEPRQRHLLMNASLLVTRVEDSYGNWVEYSYDRHRLTRIHANDGREINVGYAARPDAYKTQAYRVTTVTA